MKFLSCVKICLNIQTRIQKSIAGFISFRKTIRVLCVDPIGQMSIGDITYGVRRLPNCWKQRLEFKMIQGNNYLLGESEVNNNLEYNKTSTNHIGLTLAYCEYFSY